MEEIKSFLIAQCGDPAKNSFEPPTDFDGLSELLVEFGNQAAGQLYKDAIAEVMYGQTLEAQAKSRQDEYIAYQKSQNRFAAANGALNGLLAGTINPNDQYLSGLHRKAVELADALIAELEKPNAN